MGVPAFFRWVAAKYPAIMVDVLEGGDRGCEGEAVDAALVREVEARSGAPRWVEVDNLYIDTNGVVHPCCHPEGGAPQPKSTWSGVSGLARARARGDSPADVRQRRSGTRVSPRAASDAVPTRASSRNLALGRRNTIRAWPLFFPRIHVLS